jgi:aryl-alcohol dehydrogenase-like predicted oxidoreductase
MGLISDKYATDTLLPDNDVRGKPAPDWMRYFENGRPSPRWLARRDAIRDILAGDGRTPVQGALAWIWARSPATVPRCRASAPWTMCGRTSARSAAVR